jgi:type VI secretion system protein ImpK
MMNLASPPKAVSTKRSPAPPKQPSGTFLSRKPGARRSGLRRRCPLGAIPPREDEDTRLAAVLHHRNPLLEASRVLLRALVDMPALVGLGYHENVRDLLMDEVRVFTRLCERANIRVEHRVGARYCLCTALDEAAMRALSTQGDAQGSAAWASDALTIRMGEDNRGGAKVYALAMHLLNDEDDHTSLLEVIYRIVSLGFEGNYRPGAARRTHERVRERIYDAIVSRMPSVPDALSTHVQLEVRPRHAAYFEVPVWMSVLVLLLALLGLYAYCRVDLGARAADVRQQLADIVQVTTTPQTTTTRSDETPEPQRVR